MLQVANKSRKELLRELAAAQKRLDELKATSETHFAYLIKDAAIANFLFSPRGAVVSANTAQLKMLGAAEFARVIQKALFDSNYWTPELRGRLANGEVLRLHIALDNQELAGEAPGGPSEAAARVIHLECSVSLLGEQGYAVQARDITDEVRSKAALRDRELFFRSVFQAIPYPTLVWKHGGNDEFNLYFYNSSALDYSAGHIAKFDNADLDEFYSHAPEFPQRIRQTFRTGQPVSVEQRHTLRTTGEERFIRITSAKVGHEYVLDSMADLTELKQVQEALVEVRQALERSLAEKELLLQEVHHRIKNNLGLLNSLLELQGAVLNHDQLRAILRDTQNRILTVARVHEALYSSESIGEIDLSEYINRLGTELREALAGQDIKMEYNLDRCYLPQRSAIYYGLLANELISNVFKHAFPTDLGRPGEVEVSLHANEGWIEFSVEDNGIGLPSGFSQEQGGSLGVHVVAMLVEQMEGSVTYASEPGHGTIVRVRIPRLKG